MKPTARLQPLRNRDMAFEALGVARLLANFVTAQAFGQAFELGVCLR